MAGMPKIHFPISCKGEGAQAFFDQAIGQLHGYWYFESERSFRQVAAINPACAMAYWGMAMANAYNEGRARTFLRKGLALRGKSDAREVMWLDALAGFYGEAIAATPSSGAKPNAAEITADQWQSRRRDYLRALEAIIEAHPNDLEAKAFLVSALWDFNGNFTQYDKGIPSLPLPSRVAVEALAREVLAKNPLHPLHHYLIHLWDGDFAARGLASAYRSGPSSPGIAHMWHMSGHIYSKLHRTQDTLWTQEASSRVDHAYMSRDDVFPDQIHNYAHNNDWLVQSYAQVGRVRDAIEQAKNLIEVPRHPRWNSTVPSTAKGAVFATAQDKRENSASFGRRRLLEVGVQFELWDELLRLRDTPYLEDLGDDAADAVARSRAMGLASYAKGRRSEGDAELARLQRMLASTWRARQKRLDEAERSARTQKLNEDQTARSIAEAVKAQAGAIKQSELAVAELQLARAIAISPKPSVTPELVESIKGLPKQRQSVLLFAAGDRDRALALAREAADGAPGDALPMASLVDLSWRAGRIDDAQEAFRRLLPRSGSLDRDVPVFARLSNVAASVGRTGDWRAPYLPDKELSAFHPPLAPMGPRFWSPPRAPDWSLPRADGKTMSLAQLRGKPTVMIFYLGSGCPHCLEQLTAFAPAAARYAAAGISLVAVSTDSVEGLKQTVSLADRAQFPFPLLSDQKQEVFKKYRAFDGFENMPLHGTFLIDGQGLIRWHDISYEPYKDVNFLLTEAKRLLKVKPRPDDRTPSPASAKAVAAR